ncbi:hypothetical protein B0H14DRAFT_3438515 [Mycena olivaceomarginata]|nr:hypothetical protein B0H14DRAFT_3438515 [Mycena olivaceomarginata]
MRCVPVLDTAVYISPRTRTRTRTRTPEPFSAGGGSKGRGGGQERRISCAGHTAQALTASAYASRKSHSQGSLASGSPVPPPLRPGSGAASQRLQYKLVVHHQRRGPSLPRDQTRPDQTSIEIYCTTANANTSSTASSPASPDPGGWTRGSDGEAGEPLRYHSAKCEPRDRDRDRGEPRAGRDPLGQAVQGGGVRTAQAAHIAATTMAT